jgi:hypothetical protein
LFNGVNDTSYKFIAIINDTADHWKSVAQSLMTGVVDTGDKFAEQFITGVFDTADKHSFVIICAHFFFKVETILMGYSGPRGTMIHEKKLKSKISCQAPFKTRFSAIKNFK